MNLPKLLRAAKAKGGSVLVLDDGDERTVVALSETRLAVHLGGRVWLADVVVIPCLNDRVRPLLKCPRAHKGNFQSLYYRAGELTCRHCHALRYRTTLATGVAERARLARLKLISQMGGDPSSVKPDRKPYCWRKRYRRLAMRLVVLTGLHYGALRAKL